jgi:hypothetical protein
MGIVFACVAVLLFGVVDRELPPQITPIAELDSVEQFRHAEVLQVRRDFGQSNVNVALDAWMPQHDDERIDAVRVWWSDEFDRYPFNAHVRKHLGIETRRVAPSRWRIAVAGDGKRFAFDVALHEGRPAVFADVVLDDGRVVRGCRAHDAFLQARRFLGIPIGIAAMTVSCTDHEGTRHRGSIPMRRTRRR